MSTLMSVIFIAITARNQRISAGGNGAFPLNKNKLHPIRVHFHEPARGTSRAGFLVGMSEKRILRKSSRKLPGPQGRYIRQGCFFPTHARG